MLVEHLEGRPLEQLFVPAAAYRPFPALHEREAWRGLPQAARARLLSDGEEALPYAWPALPATLYLDYARSGNRSRFQTLYFERRKKLVKLVLAECVEHQGRFVDAIINGIWAVCEESCWTLPAHLYLSQLAKEHGLPDASEHTIDLMASETGVLLAGVYYLLQDVLDRVSPSICIRIRHELRLRIFVPYLNRDDFFWMGFASDDPVNNWNPWCNSGCLFSFLVVEEDPDRRSQAIGKIIRSLDRFLSSYPEDGGCDEGPAYWDRAGGALFDCLDMLYVASNGQFKVYDEPLVRQIGLYICKVFIDGDYYVNFADAQARLQVDGSVLYRFGDRLQEPNMTALGKYAMSYMKDRDSLTLHRVVPMLFLLGKMGQMPAAPPYMKNAWLPYLQLMTAREQSGSAEGFFLAAKGGHNDEHHNHNDVGHFVVYYNGFPVLIDAGTETYSAKTFSPQRYEIWTMRSAYHNLPVVNGCEQLNGREYAAAEVYYEADERGAALSMNLAQAYPAEAGLSAWNRSIRLSRGNAAQVTVTDTFELETPGKGIQMNLMLRYEPRLSSRNNLVVKIPDDSLIEIELESEQDVRIQLERIALEDQRMQASWGEELYRVKLFPAATLGTAVWTYRIRVISGNRKDHP